MNATKVEQVLAACEAGSVLPQKSTYFLPKLATGLVMYRLDGAAPAARTRAVTAAAGPPGDDEEITSDTLRGGPRPHLPARARRAHEPGSGAARRLPGPAARPVPRHRLRHRRAVVPAAGARSGRDRRRRRAAAAAGGAGRARPRRQRLAAASRDRRRRRAKCKSDGRSGWARRRSIWSRPTRRTGRWRAAGARRTKRARSRTRRSRWRWPSGSRARRARCVRGAGWRRSFPPTRRGAARGAARPRDLLRAPAALGSPARGRARVARAGGGGAGRSPARS